jgi:YgiT-type zinc finger domain-containing protein
MEWATAPFSVDRRGVHVSWDAIPAWVCTQCGEPFFEAREVNRLQSVLRAVEQETALLRARP